MMWRRISFAATKHNHYLIMLTGFYRYHQSDLLITEGPGEAYRDVSKHLTTVSLQDLLVACCALAGLGLCSVSVCLPLVSQVVTASPSSVCAPRASPELSKSFAATVCGVYGPGFARPLRLSVSQLVTPPTTASCLLHKTSTTVHIIRLSNN